MNAMPTIETAVITGGDDPAVLPDAPTKDNPPIGKPDRKSCPVTLPDEGDGDGDRNPRSRIRDGDQELATER